MDGAAALCSKDGIADTVFAALPEVWTAFDSIHQSCVERSERLSQGDLTKSIHHILVHFKGCVENKGMTVPIQDETEQVRLHAVSLSCASKKNDILAAVNLTEEVYKTGAPAFSLVLIYLLHIYIYLFVLFCFVLLFCFVVVR